MNHTRITIIGLMLVIIVQAVLSSYDSSQQRKIQIEVKNMMRKSYYAGWNEGYLSTANYTNHYIIPPNLDALRANDSLQFEKNVLLP